MGREQPYLTPLAPKSPQELVHENLTRAVIRYRGNIRAYYRELFRRNVHVRGAIDEPLQALTAQRLRRLSK